MSGPKSNNGAADEASEGSLSSSPELEEALREATEAVEARQSEREDGAENGGQAEAPAADEPEIEVELEAGEGEAPTPSGSGEAPSPASAEASEELETLKQKYVRLAADFDNFRKRTLKDREEAHKFGHQNLVKDLLPSVDNLERAIAHARKSEEGEVEGLLEGVELVSRELMATLTKHGVTAIDPDGEAFDPALHEAMAQKPDASVPPNTVVEVFQRGYQLRARLLRPAMVVVSTAPPADADADAETEPETPAEVDAAGEEQVEE